MKMINKISTFIEDFIEEPMYDKHVCGSYISFTDYVTSHCLISLNLPRQIGKTTLIGQLASEKDLIVCHGHRAIKHIKKEIGINPKTTCIDRSTRIDSRHSGKPPFEVVWFDECNLTPEMLHNMLHVGMVNEYTKFIELQTKVIK